MKNIHITTGSHKRHVYIICMILALVALIPVAQLHAAIPEEFTDEVVVDGLNLPTTFAFAPDGRIFIAEKDGKVRVVKEGRVLSTPFYTIPDTNTHIDRGLIGLAVDPHFAENGWVYLSYTYENSPDTPTGPKMAQIIRVKASGDVALPDTVEVLIGSEVGDAVRPSCNDFVPGTDCIPSDSGSHSAGGLRFGPDGKLYATLGDGAGFTSADPNAYKAQDLDWLTGKILRLNTDGTAPTDNPFYTGNPNDNRSKVYAYGIRNSFRFDFRESNGSLYVGEVGWGGAEEINVVGPGDNLGWPCREGYVVQGSYDCEADGYDDPMYSYGPADGAVSVTGGGFAGDAYPEEYQDSYFFGDFHRSDLYRMIVDENDEMVSLETWHDGSANGPVSILPAPDGSIYYIAIFSGELRQFVHDSMRGASEPPIANDDNVQTVKNTDVLITPLQNDTDINRDQISVTDVGAANHGTATLLNTETVSYTPDPEFVGVDSFTYTITDETFSATGTITIEVKEGGDPTLVDVVHEEAVRSIDVPVVGQNVTFTSTARNQGDAGPVLVVFSLHDNVTEEKVAELVYDNEAMAGGAATSFEYTWLPGKAGSYRLDVGYFEAGWGEMHQWVYNAMTFDVFDREPPEEPLTLEINDVTVNDSNPTVGETVTVEVAVTNVGRGGTGVVDLQIFDEAANSIAQESYEEAVFAHDQTKVFTMDWVPNTEGTFWAEAGTFGSGWTPFMNWAWHGAEITVAQDDGTSTGTTTPFMLDIASVSVDTSTPKVGELVQVEVTVVNTGQAGSGLVDMHVFDDQAVSVDQKAFEDVAFAESEERTFVMDWVPNTEGTFWAEAGTFGSGWTPFMDWAWHGAEVIVEKDTGASTGDGMFVFEDSLSNNWSDWSWDTTADFAHTAASATDDPVIHVEHLTGWSGFFLHADESVSLSNFTELTMKIRGEDAGGQKLQIKILDDTDTFVTEIELDTLTDSWETVVIDLKDISETTNVTGIIIQERSGEANTNYFVNDIRFQ